MRAVGLSGSGRKSVPGSTFPHSDTPNKGLFTFECLGCMGGSSSPVCKFRKKKYICMYVLPQRVLGYVGESSACQSTDTLDRTRMPSSKVLAPKGRIHLFSVQPESSLWPSSPFYGFVVHFSGRPPSSHPPVCRRMLMAVVMPMLWLPACH